MLGTPIFPLVVLAIRMNAIGRDLLAQGKVNLLVLQIKE
jgi:hypothetical protein